MGDKTAIQWTDASWNPVVGCDRVSPGCDHCYAASLHNKRYLAWKRGTWPSAPAQYHRPFWTGEGHVQLMHDRLDLPKHWRKPRRIFVNSVSDLFHPDVPGEFINQVWMTMFNVRHHTYQVLTKRPERLLEWTKRKAAATCWPIEDIWPSWIWLGTSVEDQAAADLRVPLLLQTPARVRFLSCEPLLGPVDLDRAARHADGTRRPNWGLDLQWVIIGGESGRNARPMSLEWAYLLLDQCQAAGVPVFVKQLGSVWATMNHKRDRHGGDMAEWSATSRLRVREWPALATS